ncbi:hypothetical protein [Amycolatopsis magusensis]|uniref:Small secreted domain n=1 Tax=Amycolatopsis magusensis TaxID=882444 RepID=A0ABS4Q4U7_9PSEU|nr:hypothetical protein [Amycolatopsis magusensis]MBP2186709.1 hypothetical protein [Amycolatopsis magusensis]MDI5982135.1 hypothetical protein [Amycolatopsis magusensis]
MLKKIGAVAGTVAASVVVFGGVAAAADGETARTFDDTNDGLVNANNVDVLHDVRGAVGFCGQNINVLIVQVPVHDVANGIDVPLLPAGVNSAEGQTPDNCASDVINTDDGRP